MSLFDSHLKRLRGAKKESKKGRWSVRALKRAEVYITQLRRNAMGVGLVFEANLHTKDLAQEMFKDDVFFRSTRVSGSCRGWR